MKTILFQVRKLPQKSYLIKETNNNKTNNKKTMSYSIRLRNNHQPLRRRIIFLTISIRPQRKKMCLDNNRPTKVSKMKKMNISRNN
jgi:hypothetical protein